MKNLLLFIICLLCGALTLQAGPGNLGKGAKNLSKKVLRKAKSSVSKVESTRPAKRRPTTHISETTQKVTEKRPSRQGTQTTAPHHTSTIKPREPVAARQTRTLSMAQFSRETPQAAPSAMTRSMSRIEKELADLEAQNQALLAEQQALSFRTDIGKSVLYAPLINGESLGYSVTVVKVGEEIFGVIPSHSLYYDHGFSHLSKNFYVNIVKEGKTQRVPVEVVQVSPSSMLDISLVKFAAEDEKFLVPLEISDAPFEMGEELYSYGFAAGKETFITRSVNAQSLLSVRTNQAIEGCRSGFCGSPLLDAQGRVKAIHVGTVEKMGDIPDVSYGAHARFINLLIDAYHNKGLAHYNLILNDQRMAVINVDEYVSAYYLFDGNGKLIAQQNITGKFSESQLRTALEQHPQANYLQLTTRKVAWKEETNSAYKANNVSAQTNEMLNNPTHFNILEENRGKTDKTKQQHWYNLQTQQIEAARPAIIKM